MMCKDGASGVSSTGQQSSHFVRIRFSMWVSAIQRRGMEVVRNGMGRVAHILNRVVIVATELYAEAPRACDWAGTLLVELNLCYWCGSRTTPTLWDCAPRTLACSKDGS